MTRRTGEYAPRMRGVEYYCLVAAAVLWNAPLPAKVFWATTDDGARGERPLDVAVTLPARAPRAKGVRGRSIRPGWATVRVHPATGLRLTSPATTWAMMAELLGRDDLIALGDAFVRVPVRSDDPPALTTIAELEAALGVGRRTGAAALRAALPLIRTRSRSRKETDVRLLVVDAGMPEPELNWPLVVEGVIVALLDLAYPELRLAFEYEGEQHLTNEAQWARDIRRYEQLADLGWRVIRITKSDLAEHRGSLIARLRRAYAAASERPAR
ncbi:endonuclease domain-containing protein [Microbacterium sp. CJ88]|uniref:endonuclease domain-containing protein n=1 Tax=Microbacterium sp. CJ88 TaxID=3445672 RepID=UPI003F65AB28